MQIVNCWGDHEKPRRVTLEPHWKKVELAEITVEDAVNMGGDDLADFLDHGDFEICHAQKYDLSVQEVTDLGNSMSEYNNNGHVRI